MTMGVVSIRVETDVLDERARAAGVSRSEFVRQLVAGLGGEGGVWIAYYPDMSGLAAYASEVDALRAANGTSMEVKFVRYGEGI